MVFQVGNPGGPGRPKKNEAMRAALERALAIKDPVTGKPDRDAIALALVKEAKRGNVDAIKHVFDRIDGKVTDTKVVEQSGEVKHRVEVTYSRRAHQPGPAGAAREPGADQG